jgi:hypothetical protein
LQRRPAPSPPKSRTRQKPAGPDPERANRPHRPANSDALFDVESQSFLQVLVQFRSAVAPKASSSSVSRAFGRTARLRIPSGMQCFESCHLSHGIVGCCARTASGHAATAPPRRVMNSRRRISAPKLRGQHCIGQAGIRPRHHPGPLVPAASRSHLGRRDGQGDRDSARARGSSVVSCFQHRRVADRHGVMG